MGYYHVVPFWVLPSENSQVAGVKLPGGPLALDGKGRSPPWRPDEVNLMLLLVSPIADRPALRGGKDFIQHEVLPKVSEIIVSQGRPSPIIADESRIESVNLGGRHNFFGAVPVKRTYDMDDECLFKNLQIIRNGRLRHFARLGETLRLEHPARLDHQQFSEFQERMAAFQSKQFLDILGPIGVHPLLIVSLRQRVGQKERGQSAPQESVFQVGFAKIAQIRKRHRRQPKIGFSTSQCVAEFSRSPQCGRSRRQNSDGRIMIRRDLQKLRRIVQPMDFVQDNALSLQPVPKILRVFHRLADARQFTVEVFDVVQRFRKACLSDPSNTSQPDDRAKLPCLFNTPFP